MPPAEMALQAVFSGFMTGLFSSVLLWHPMDEVHLPL